LAACYLKLEQPKQALTNANKALEIDSRNVKGLWRQGLGFMDDGDWDKAKKSFEIALEVDPGTRLLIADLSHFIENKSVQASFKKLKAIMLQYEKKQQALYKNLFA
jgi:tetratricopeptide (TPR) repeat protein